MTELEKLNVENQLMGKRLEMMLALAREFLDDINKTLSQLADHGLRELSIPRL